MVGSAGLLWLSVTPFLGNGLLSDAGLRSIVGVNVPLFGAPVGLPLGVVLLAGVWSPVVVYILGAPAGVSTIVDLKFEVSTYGLGSGILVGELAGSPGHILKKAGSWV